MILLDIREEYNNKGSYFIDFINTKNNYEEEKNDSTSFFDVLRSFHIDSNTQSNTEFYSGFFKDLCDNTIAIRNRNTYNYLQHIENTYNLDLTLEYVYDFEGLCTALEGCLRDAKEINGLCVNDKYIEAYTASEKLINYIYNDFSDIQQLFAIYNNLESIITVLGDNYLQEVKAELKEKADILRELSLEDDFTEYREVLSDIRNIVHELESKDFLEQFNILGD